MAAHAQERDAQSLLCWPGRLGRHLDARLWRDAVTSPTDPFLPHSFLLSGMSLYLCAPVYLTAFLDFQRKTEAVDRVIPGAETYVSIGHGQPARARRLRSAGDKAVSYHHHPPQVWADG